MVDGYSPMKGYISRLSVASVCSSKSRPFVAGSPLSLYTQGEYENEYDEEYVCVSVDDSKLEFDTLDDLSIATKTGQNSVSAPARVRKHVLGT
jgi:hypothetical protein